MRTKVSYTLDPHTVTSLRCIRNITQVPMSWIVEEAVLEKVAGFDQKTSKDRYGIVRCLGRIALRRTVSHLNEVRAKISMKVLGGAC